MRPVRKAACVPEFMIERENRWAAPITIDRPETPRVGPTGAHGGPRGQHLVMSPIFSIPQWKCRRGVLLAKDTIVLRVITTLPALSKACNRAVLAPQGRGFRKGEHPLNVMDAI